MMKRIIFTILFSLAALLSGAAQANNDWVEYESDHVLLYSNANPELAQSLVEDLEIYRAFLIRLTNVDPNYIAAKEAAGTDAKFLVFGTKNVHSFKTITGVEDISISFLHPRGQVTFVDFGLHPDPFEGKRGKPGRQMLFYEYTRYFLEQYSSFNYPIWYTQGLSMYLSTFEFENGVATVAAPHLRTVRILGGPFSHHLIPVEYMMGSTREFVKEMTGLGHEVEWTQIEQSSNFTFDNNAITFDHNHSGLLNPETQVRVFKYQAWGIVHYLQSKPELRTALVDYLVKLNAGEDFEAAFEDTFNMTLDEMHQQVYDYTERKLFASYQIEDPDMVFDIKVSRRDLDSQEGAYVEVWGKSFMLGQKKRLFAIKNQLKTIGGRHRNDAETLIAEMDFFNGNADKALQTVERVLARSPEFGRANGLKGAILVEQNNIEEGRRFLRRAVRADQNDLIALSYLGRTYLMQAGGNVEEGAGVMSRLVALTPANENARLQLAALDQMTGFGSHARPELQVLSAWGSNAGIRARAAACLSAIQSGVTCNPLYDAPLQTADAGD